MTRFFTKAAAAAAAALMLGSAAANASTQISISIGDSGYWGVLPALTGYRPEVWNNSPIVAIGTAVAGLSAIYLNVPDAERHDWKNHCRKYDACNRPVHFVKNDWYRDQYAPEYRRQHPKQEPPREAKRDDRGIPPGQAKKQARPQPQHQEQRRAEPPRQQQKQHVQPRERQQPQQHREAPRQQPRGDGPQNHGGPGHEGGRR